VETDASVKSEALQIIEKQQKSHPSVNLGFLSLAVQGKAMGFEKVLKMVDNMVKVLKKQQVDDDKKIAYCNRQIEVKGDTKVTQERTVKNSAIAMASSEETIASLNSDLAALAQGIADLDKQTADATTQRKNENGVCKDLKASNGAAKEVLLFAKNRLNKFYNPKQYKRPHKKIGFMSMHIEGLDFLQVAERSGNPNGEASNGVLAMVDTLIADLDKEVSVAEVNEFNSQTHYKIMMDNAKKKRAEDSKMITAKESSKANLEAELEEAKDDHKASMSELKSTTDNLAALHKDCDWLIENADVRKEARQGEIDALGKTKGVLNGADYTAI